jgi:signal transduction histidine kinase
VKTPFQELAWLDWRSGRTLVALGFAALVPASCVLWFMTIALRNERLAVQQRLTEVYQNHLVSAQRQITSHWQDRQNALEARANDPPAEQFLAIIRDGLAESAIIYDSNGKVLYPASAMTSAADLVSEPADWAAALELEFQKTNYLGAAEAYGQSAHTTTNLSLKAKSMQSQVGCLVKAGQPDRAVAILTEMVADAGFARVATDHGTLILPNAQLLLLRLLNNPTDALFQRTASNLATRLRDYHDPALSSSQRRFLMEEMCAVAPGAASFPTLPAERLAADYLEQNPAWPFDAGLQRALQPDLWRLASSHRTVVALLHEDRLRTEMKAISMPLPEAAVKLLAPGESFAATRFIPPIPAGEMLPGWRLALSFNGPNPIEAASAREGRVHFWGGLSGVLFIALVALATGRFVAAQMRLAQLKNDLVSTVTHELKTPLSSMRALVDTLRAGRYRDPQQLQTYLDLLAHENERLSHLIENVLSFSRLEQHRQRFQFVPVKAEAVVKNAVTVLQERYPSANGCLHLEIPPSLPAMRGDAEALTTVLINLLDNAWKYTENTKHIVVRAGLEDRGIFLAVADNGVGLTSQQAKRVFDRFYQADQSLARRVGGCGLGLSIVQSIVRAHGGSVTVESEPGKGSTFTVRLPLAGPGGEGSKC